VAGARRLGFWLLAVSSGLPAALAGASLGVRGARFTLNGGLGAQEKSIEQDLDDLTRLGFNWVRVWATWAAHDNDVSAVDPAGNPREPYLTKLKWLVEQADKRGMAVDVTLSRGNGAVSKDPRLASLDAHLRAVETLAGALKPWRNVYFDVGNERNIKDRRHVPFDEVKALRDRVKQLDPDRLVTASHAGELTRDDVEQYLVKCQLDFLSPHRPRNARSPWQTAEKTRECLKWAEELGRIAPVHHQEPFRRDFGAWQPKALDFLVDARQARDGGAAGWCLHNGSPKGDTKGARRSFDLREKRLFDQLDAEERPAARHVALVATASTKTWLALLDGRWYLNGRVTHPGARAEGLLMNARMVNGIFEDRNAKTCPKGFDPDANTAALIAAIPDYVKHGVRAFTLCLQGGMPGYEGARNSAFEPDGSLRPDYLKRVERVIRAADAAGAAIILGCCYQRQDQVLKDADAVRAGVANVARWVRESGFGHVAIEIANEFGHGGFNHKLLRTPQGIAELIRLARETAPGLLVSASGLGGGTCHAEVCEAADFILIHFNSTPVAEIPKRVQALRRYKKAIVCNEDDKVGNEGARAAEAATAARCSWGLMLSKINQYFPLEFKGASDDAAIYARLKDLTTARSDP